MCLQASFIWSNAPFSASSKPRTTFQHLWHSCHSMAIPRSHLLSGTLPSFSNSPQMLLNLVSKVPLLHQNCVTLLSRANHGCYLMWTLLTILPFLQYAHMDISHHSLLHRCSNWEVNDGGEDWYTLFYNLWTDFRWHLAMMPVCLHMVAGSWHTWQNTSVTCNPFCSSKLGSDCQLSTCVANTLDRQRLSTFRHYSLGYFVVRFRFPSIGPSGLKSGFSCQWSALYLELVQRISSRFSVHKVMCVYVFSPSWTIRDDESLSTNTWYERLMSFQWWFALHSTPLWNDFCAGSMTTMHYSIYLKWNLRYTLKFWDTDVTNHSQDCMTSNKSFVIC